MKEIQILGGGTFNHVRNHLSLSAPAFGTTARQIFDIITFDIRSFEYNTKLTLTKMADHSSSIVTNDDVSTLLNDIINNKNTKIVFFNMALCDYTGQIDNETSGKYSTRLQTNTGDQIMNLTPADKLIKRIRQHRKDIFLVAFKTTCGATEQEQYIAGLDLLKSNSVNLVLANDTKNHRNMIIVPEEAKYCVTTDRNKVLKELVDIALLRSSLHYTRSVVMDGESIDWNGNDIPESLRTVVNYCISRGAYKPFKNKTAGHFAFKADETTILTSKRATNFNNLDTVGLVKVESTDRYNVVAYGAKPSVGGMSQRIIFTDHPGYDCIVHFHCPPTEDYMKHGLPIQQQRPYECGSHECGDNTSKGLIQLEDGIKVVYLDQHGPNIVFKKNTNPDKVIQYIDKYFDLSLKTGGSVSIN